MQIRIHLLNMPLNYIYQDPQHYLHQQVSAVRTSFFFLLKVMCNEKRGVVSKMAVVSIEYGDIDIFPFLPSTDESLGAWHVNF
jgi:hypothetical protein